MKRMMFLVCFALLVTAGVAFAAGPGQAEFDKWARGVKISGYSYGGVEQTDPGVFMAGWMNPKGNVLGVHLNPISSFKSYQQVVNRKKPEAFTYKGASALYSDATGFGLIAIKYQNSGKVLVISQMGESKGLSKAELIKLLDVMKPEKLLN